MTNNIFTYATSELSQDAFLLYLFNYANTNTNEGKFARKLLNAFFKKNNKNNFINENNYNDFEIYSYKQFLKIDVLIVFINSKNKENSFCLVIEDKIKATQSKENQLESYIKELRNEKIPEWDINNKKINLDEILRDINIIPIYFKNGFLQSWENNCKNIVDYLFGIEDIINIVGELDSFNDIIVKQWIEKIKQTENEIKVVKNFINKENNKTTLVDLSNLVSEKGYSALNITNVLADFLFDGNSKKYETFKENAMGHPETDVNFFRFRKEVNKNGFYEKLNVKSAQFTLVFRFTNFGFRIVFQINYEYEYKNRKDETKTDFTHVKQDFEGIKEDLKEYFDKEKEKLYVGINSKINALKNENIKIGKIIKKNITMANFDSKIQKLNIKDLKTIIIKIGEIFLEIAKEKGYEEDKSEEYVSYGTN